MLIDDSKIEGLLENKVCDLDRGEVKFYSRHTLRQNPVLSLCSIKFSSQGILKPSVCFQRKPNNTGNSGHIELLCGCVISLVGLVAQPYFYPWGKSSKRNVFFNKTHIQYISNMIY